MTTFRTRALIRAALLAELLRQESAVTALLKPEDQERFRRTQ